MRNLQKILALVLALVMSLSLMATASADFTDQADIDETFAESVDVLNGLEVFQGYPTGDFQPKGEITRAEVAAIIYRIATGDVGDTQVGIYADYNKFSDVYASETYSGWAAGYINYCANAEYIKGRGDGKFYPQDKVTGYEALAMILRVVGYDKNGEFTGNDWAVQTAAIANQRHVTDNINAGLLGQPATREMVAEILCKAILLNTVNYTLAYGYQISTNPQDTIAYQTFKMECVEGVVTGNEIADLENTSPMTAGQTRLVVDGEKKVMNFTTGLESIGKSVRAYIRPQNGTTVKQLVPGKVYDTDKNHVYDSFAKVSVGNSTGKDNGITSIVGAEHFVNYDYLSRWTANIRITYIMDVQWTEYEAFTMRRDNGGRLFEYKDHNDALDPNKPGIKGPDRAWNTQLTTNADYTYTYTKTIAYDELLSEADYNNLLSIFTDADRTSTTASTSRWIQGEVYVGTASYGVQDDVSDEIRWADFVSAYLKNEDNRAQIESNGLGNRLIIIDNNDDGIAEYVLQTIYTIGKVASDGKHLDNINQKLDNDEVNSTVSSNALVSVSGKELAKSEDALAAGDVVLYALIDGNIRAQKPETKTEKINTVNRASKTLTTAADETYNESAVHEHAEGLKSYVSNMAGNTTYTMFFDLDGNMAAFTEEIQNNLVLITNAWYNSTISGPQYAVQYWRDGQLQTAEVNSNGSYFIKNSVNSNANSWGNLKENFGGIAPNGNTGSINNQGTGVRTIVANLEGNVLTPVDKAYLYAQQLRVLDMKNNTIPGRDNTTTSKAQPYETNYADTAYHLTDGTEAEVRALSNTVYYTVYRGNGTDPMTNNDQNVVVREYVGYNAMPSIDRTYIEDVYAIGAKATAYDGTVYYTAQIVVIELNNKYTGSRIDSEQVFIPDFSEVTGNVGDWENVRVIRGTTGAVETVKIDLNHSTLPTTYDPAGGMNTRSRMPGLYYMDLKDGSNDVYVIEWMDASAVRANNYRAGYVNKSTALALNDYVQVDMMAKSTNNSTWVQDRFGNAYVNVNYPTVPANDMAKLQSGKLVVDSKLYNLSYSSGVASLSEPVAVTTPGLVLGQTKADGLGCLATNTLNERWVIDESTGTRVGTDNFTNTSYNEVLIRCNAAGDIIWAISFAEGNSATSVNFAQQVWYNCLPATTAQTDLKFYGVADATEAGTADQDVNAKAITVTYNTAVQSGKLLDLDGIRATITNYRIERLDNGTWDNGTWTDITGDPEITEVRELNPAVTKTYRLTVTRNTGLVEVYKLIQLKQTPDGQLVSQNAAINVQVQPTAAYKTTAAAAIAASTATNDVAVLWVKNPENIDVAKLVTDDYLKYMTGAEKGTIAIEYVEDPNGVDVTTRTNETIDQAVDFNPANGVQNAGKIVVKVTNYDGEIKYIQLCFVTDTTPGSNQSIEQHKASTKQNLWSFIERRAKIVGISMDVINADTGVKGQNGNVGNGIIAEYNWLCDRIDAMTTIGEVDEFFWYHAEDDGDKTTTEAWGSKRVLDGAWNFIDDRTGTGYTTNLKDALIAEIAALAAEQNFTSQMNDLNRLLTAANTQAGTDQTKKDAIKVAYNAAYNAIVAATSKAQADKAVTDADKAMRDVLAPTVKPSTTKADVAYEIANDPSASAFNGVDVYVSDQVTIEGDKATLKVTGPVTWFASAAWDAGPGAHGMGAFNSVAADQATKFGLATADITKMAVIPVTVNKANGGTDLQLIAISDANVNYARSHAGATYKVINYGGGFQFNLDLSGVTSAE